jgi:hypothetical protein
LKLNRLRVFQASGLGALIMLPLNYVLGLIFSSSNINMDYEEAIIWYTLPTIVIGQFVIGYWIGRHVDYKLFSHVFLANMLIVVVNYIYTFLVYGILLKSIGSVLIVTVILAWPIAVWVKKRRLSKRNVQVGRWS